jgi:predicted HicB family RNase H-like nuclease
MATRTKQPAEEDQRVQVQFRLSSGAKRRLRREADRRQVSTNFLIEKALDEALAKWEKEKL